MDKDVHGKEQNQHITETGFVKLMLPQLDEFRTVNWKRIQYELKQSIIMELFENKVV